jgi:hypothetical protein
VGIAKKNGFPAFYFIRVMDGEWNTTYKLLKQVVEHRELFTNFVRDTYQVEILDENWTACEKIVDILRPFYIATKCLVGVYHPTGNLFLRECFNIVSKLRNYCEDAQLNVREAVFIIFKIWINIFTTLPKSFLLAAYLDPRVKLQGLKEDHTKYVINLTQIANAGGLTLQLVDVDGLTDEAHNIISSMCTYDFSSSSNVQVPSGGQIDQYAISIRERYTRNRTPTAELEHYLNSWFEFYGDFSGREFNILAWWRTHAFEFPSLSRTTIEILSIPLSTIPIECSFSSEVNILSKRRYSLHPENLEELTCLDDWGRAENRAQDQAPIGETPTIKLHKIN